MSNEEEVSEKPNVGSGLTEEVRLRIRAEEEFRESIRKELKGSNSGGEPEQFLNRSNYEVFTRPLVRTILGIVLLFLLFFLLLEFLVKEDVNYSASFTPRVPKLNATISVRAGKLLIRNESALNTWHHTSVVINHDYKYSIDAEVPFYATLELPLAEFITREGIRFAHHSMKVISLTLEVKSQDGELMKTFSLHEIDT